MVLPNDFNVSLFGVHILQLIEQQIEEEVFEDSEVVFGQVALDVEVEHVGTEEQRARVPAFAKQIDANR